MARDLTTTISKRRGLAGENDFGMATQPPAGVSATPKVADAIEQVLEKIDP